MVDGISPPNAELSTAGFSVGFEGVPDSVLTEFTPREVILGESLLTPGLQTSVSFDSYLHTLPTKNFDAFKNAKIGISISKPGLANYGLPTDINLSQRVYRMDKRGLINNNNERFTLRACDQSQLDDPKTLVSKSWKCAPPSSVVSEVLSTCLGVAKQDVEYAWYPRDYIAENIHPFQVISQQTNYAVAEGSDPSFLHYMTYQNGGTHHFRSIRSLSQMNPIMNYVFNDTGNTYSDPYSILRYNFPCDFDILSDILNGIDEKGRNINSVILLNPADKTFSFFNQDFNLFGCGIGSGVMKVAISNQNTAQRQDMCQDYASAYLQFRQSRMSLLEKDKIALRVVVPFNPKLNVGKVINVKIYNKEGKDSLTLNYGSGDYLILHMFHHVVNGGLATTTMDCVSRTYANRGAIL